MAKILKKVITFMVCFAFVLGGATFVFEKKADVVEAQEPQVVEKIADVIPLCDMVLVMSVFPGFGGQKFIPEALEKLRQVKVLIDQTGKQIDLEIDGGVTEENVEEIKAAGANVIVAGSTVFKAADRAKIIATLKK